MATTNNNDDLLDEAKKLAAIVAETEIGESILAKVKDSASELLHEIEAKSEAIGLGSVVERAVNIAVNQDEKVTSRDLNQDKMVVGDVQMMAQSEINAQAAAARAAMEAEVTKAATAQMDQMNQSVDHDSQSTQSSV